MENRPCRICGATEATRRSLRANPHGVETMELHHAVIAVEFAKRIDLKKFNAQIVAPRRARPNPNLRISAIVNA